MMNNFDGGNINNTNSNGSKYNNEEESSNVTGMLLNLSQKTTIFVDDQTPTPTRLIKNCEEVGLFEDLYHVNPFEETFRKACEQCSLQSTTNRSNIVTTVKTTGTSAITDDETSLHTPQVFPQYDVAGEGGLCDIRNDNLPKHPLDMPTTGLEDGINGSQIENGLNVNNLIKVVSCLEQIDNSGSNSYNVKKPSFSDKTVSELKHTTIITAPTTITPTTTASSTFLPTTLQYIQQSQIIPITYPANIQPEQEQKPRQQEILLASSIKSKPLILPKLFNSQMNNIKNAGSTLIKNTKLFNNNKPIAAITTHNNNTNNNNNEPSSASLTPTSQLPIKERLKAILSQNGKSHLQEWPKNNNTYNNNNKIDTMARRRAASSRYRHKMRIEHKELKKQNMQLQSENENLKKHIKDLEVELQTIANNNKQFNKQSGNVCQQNLSTQLHIPASTIHLIMNMPKMMIPLDHPRHHGDNYL